MKKLLILLTTISMCLMVFAGCQKKDNISEPETPTVTTPQEEEKSLATFNYVTFKTYDPVYIAKDKGFFDEEGLNVELLETTAGGPGAIQLVASGDAQGGQSSTAAIINGCSAGLPVIGVVDYQSSFEDRPLEEFFVRKDSGIKSIEDLKGKTVAINLVKSSFHYTWLMALEQAGMSESDVNFVNLSFDLQQEALNRGEVDAIGVLDPYSKSCETDENLELLFDAYDIFGARQFSEIFVNSVWAEDHQEETEKFVSAVVKAINWVPDHQEEAKEIISKYSNVAVENIHDYKFQENGMTIADDAKFWLDYKLRTEEGIATWLTPEDIVTNKYNKAIK